eukprot:3147958-Amphidinium_carterae.1
MGSSRMLACCSAALVRYAATQTLPDLDTTLCLSFELKATKNLPRVMCCVPSSVSSCKLALPPAQARYEQALC